MTTIETHHPDIACPGQEILKLLSGKWKPEILRLASRDKAIRFNTLLKQLPGSNKQSVAVALRELEHAKLLSKQVINEKPLHIEYTITEKGLSMIPIYKMAANIALESNIND